MFDDRNMAGDLGKLRRWLAAVGVVVFLLLASPAAARPPVGFVAVENSTKPTKEAVRRAGQLPSPPPAPAPESTVWVNVSMTRMELPWENRSLVFHHLPRLPSPPSAPSLGGNDIKT